MIYLNIENGKKGMSQDTLYKLCSKFAVSADYRICYFLVYSSFGGAVLSATNSGTLPLMNVYSTYPFS